MAIRAARSNSSLPSRLCVEQVTSKQTRHQACLTGPHLHIQPDIPHCRPNSPLCPAPPTHPHPNPTTPTAQGTPIFRYGPPATAVRPRIAERTTTTEATGHLLQNTASPSAPPEWPTSACPTRSLLHHRREATPRSRRYGPAEGPLSTRTAPPNNRAAGGPPKAGSGQAEDWEKPKAHSGKRDVTRGKREAGPRRGKPDLEPRRRAPDTEPQTPDVERQTPDAECRTSDVGSRTPAPDARRQARTWNAEQEKLDPDTRHRTRDAERRTPSREAGPRTRDRTRNADLRDAGRRTQEAGPGRGNTECQKRDPERWTPKAEAGTWDGSLGEAGSSSRETRKQEPREWEAGRPESEEAHCGSGSSGQPEDSGVRTHESGKPSSISMPSCSSASRMTRKASPEG
ncbi:hypothetical protein B0I32_102257 [Nonomuraea fuscirosea]|uniref:Uncharacterized protein n=1 Tax=Nonomuraea fuscirosea TaxID=1291556 RepID=A0A2T0N8Y9_9ACTN|nr:hypothetical protein B0I32_102257 [Nonomuraea fuscirosea]